MFRYPSEWMESNIQFIFLKSVHSLTDEMNGIYYVIAVHICNVLFIFFCKCIMLVCSLYENFYVNLGERKVKALPCLTLFLTAVMKIVKYTEKLKEFYSEHHIYSTVNTFIFALSCVCSSLYI